MLELLSRRGREFVAFQCLASWGRLWRGPHGGVGHALTSAAWVAAGAPWCDEAHVAATADAFVAAARAAGRRAVFFAVEDRRGLEHLHALCIGEQALFEARRWPATLAMHRRLREQLRRAGKKGVRVRRLAAEEMRPGAPTRAAAEVLLAQWLRTRQLEAMSFLAAAEPFAGHEHHRYYLAEGPAGPLSLLSLVPAPAQNGWLVEHTLRAATAPNGTTELLLDAALRDAGADATISLGLLPLSGPVVWPLRLVRRLAAPLYHFDSLARFKRRLHPHRLEPVWLVSPSRPATALLDALRAFAGDHLLRFAARSLLQRANGCCWLIAILLLPWAITLAALLLGGHSGRLALAPPALGGFVAWDLLLAWLAFRAARHPTRRAVVTVAFATGLDALFSLTHVAVVGFGNDVATIVLRAVSALAPATATALLLRAVRTLGARAPAAAPASMRR